MGRLSIGICRRAIWRGLNEFYSNRRANVAVVFALALIPVFTVAGFAVDNSRHVTTQNKLQTSLDIAALATAKRMAEESMTDAEITKAAQDFFLSQFEMTGGVKLDPIKAQEVGSEVVLSANGTLDTTMMSVIGRDTMPIGASTAVVYNIKQPVELALVLDTSGSMKGAKLTALTDAAESLVDILLPNETDPAKNTAAKLAVVPFNTYVKIDTKYKNASWMRDTAPYTRTWESCGTSNAARREAGCKQESYPCKKWTGSVEAGNRRQVDGTCKRWNCPDGAEPERTCKPKSEYRQWWGCVRSRNFPNNVEDDSYGSEKIRGIVSKNACNVSQVLELTNNHKTADTVISGLKANSNTYIPTGLIWGFRALSSKAPLDGGEDEVAFAKDKGRKAIMLMSDGANTVSPHSSNGFHNRSNVSQANEYTLDVCDNAKDENIEIYTVAFDLDDKDTKDMLKDCATDDSYYYDAENAAELQKAFATIGRELSELAIAR